MGLFDAIGGLFGGGDGGASATQRRALAEFEKIDIPDPEELKVELQKLVRQGALTPEQAKTYLVKKTAMTDVKSDPQAMTAARQALSGLQDVYEQGGLTDIDRARIADIQDTESQAERGSREAILQNAAERGVSGSGLELAAQLSNQQAAAGRKSKQDMDVAAEAQRRALEALTMAGTQGTQLQGQLFNQDAQKATAEDTINKFNAATQTQTDQFNVGQRADTSKFNLQEKQRIADENVGLRNTQEFQNKGVAQTTFDNQVTKANGMSGQLNKIADSQLEKQKRKENIGAGILNTGASILGLARGGQIPGGDGDDENRDDVVPVLLSPGETVIPDSIASNPEAAAAFAANPPPTAAPQTSVNPVVAKMLMEKYAAPGAGANNSPSAPAADFSPEARQKLLGSQGRQTPKEIAARIIAGISDSVLNANGAKGEGSAAVAEIASAKRKREVDAFDAGRADQKYSRDKAVQDMEDDPNSDVSKTYQSLAARFTGSSGENYAGRSATQLKSVLPILEKAFAAEEAAKARAFAAGQKDSFEEKEEIKRKVKAKAEYFDAKAFAPGAVKILDKLRVLNKNSYGTAVGGFQYKLSEKTGIGDETTKFKNTAEVVNQLRQMVSKVLKATFGGQLSDGERAYLDKVYGASEDFTKSQRDIAIRNVKRMFVEKLAEKQSVYDSWVQSGVEPEARKETVWDFESDFGNVSKGGGEEAADPEGGADDSADYLDEAKAKRLKELRAKMAAQNQGGN